MAIAKWPPPRLQESLEEVTPVAEALSDLSESSEVPRDIEGLEAKSTRVLEDGAPDGAQ